MNKKCFRVIFSKTLQRLVVTSELAKSEGKSTEQSAFSLSQIFAQIRPLTFSLYCALGFVAFSDSALANLIIQADKSAPKNQQPIVLQTANGLPQVNIQTPNDKGLSHNKYSKFDVDTKGAILNNSRTNVQTQQGGLITGNPYLAKGEAKVILNEVNSSDPSVLKGYVEVAGKKADVIIANPSGIHCEGCGVINSDRATFTTGKPQINNGHLDSFVVEKGKVKVSGKGLDNSRVDYTEIIARETQANAGIWSKKETKVITGKNTVKRSDTPTDLQITHTKQPLETETQPQFAIDVGELGGMYSGKIHLIGTEHGVGVRNAGHIGASTDTLHIDSQGRIVNKGTLNAHHAVQLTGTKGIGNQGKIENRQGDITFNTASDIQQDGSVVARGGNIHQTANQAIHQQGETVANGDITYTAPSVTASTSSLIASGVEVKDSAQGEVRTLETQSAQGKSITVTTTGKATLQGKNVASGNINVSSSEADLDHSQTSAYSANLYVSHGDIQANNATFTVNSTLNLTTPTVISTQGSELTASAWQINAHQMNNQSGKWLGLGRSALSLDLAGGLNNNKGLIQHQGDISLNAHRAIINNHQGTLRSLAGNIAIQAQSRFENEKGNLIAFKDLALQHEGVNNQAGNIMALTGNATLQLQNHILNNQQGTIAAQHAVFTASQLLNQEGVVDVVHDAKMTFSEGLDNSKVSEKGSLVQVGRDFRLHSPWVRNTQTKSPHEQKTQGMIANTLTLSADNLDNQQGGIYVNQGLLAIGKQLNNQAGQLFSAGNLQVKGNGLSMSNQQGEIIAADNLEVKAEQLSSFGVIEANHTTLDLAQGFASHTDIKGKQRLSITTQGEFINHAGLLSQGELTLNAKHIENRVDAKISANHIALTAQTHLTNRGLINAAGENIIKVATTLHNLGTGRIYGNHIALQADTLINEDEKIHDTLNSAVIAARQQLDIGAKHIYNQQLKLDPKQSTSVGVTLSSEGNMAFGSHLNAQHHAEGEATQLRNTSALIDAGGNLQLNIAQVENNNHYIHNVMTEKSRTPVNETFLISGNTLRTGERINFALLKWISFSRAGKVAYKNHTRKPEDPNDINTHLLPLPNEEVCSNPREGTGCVPAPKSLYLPDDPIWTYFHIEPPTGAPPVPDLSQLDPDLDAPPKPQEPRRKRMRESQEAYEARLKLYEENKAAYEQALKEYEAEKADYEANIQPYLDWVEQNEAKFKQLEEAIINHNAPLLGRTFTDFWINEVKERVIKEDVATDSVPAQILAGGHLHFSGNLTNNQSTILAGGEIRNTQNAAQTVENNDQWGERVIEDYGTEQWTYSRWRGGVKRYHQRKWGGKHAYMHETRIDIPLNIVRTEANSLYQSIAAAPTLNSEAVTVNRINVDANPLSHTTPMEIRSVGADSRLPSSSLYRIQAAPQSRVLIETDPAFADYRQWLSGDYMFKALRSEHENVHKRLGDGYYEQRLVREQINLLTGRMFSGDHTDLERQYKALMDEGISFAQKFNLRVGIALTPTQVAQLTSDIVWFEPTTVTLADGSQQTVLAPKVYVLARKGDIDGKGTLLSGNQIHLNQLSALTNQGIIYGRNVAQLNVTTLQNQGKISGGITELNANVLKNMGGVIEGEHAVRLTANELLSQSTTKSTQVNLSDYSRAQTNLNRQALIHTKGANGTLSINADHLTAIGSVIRNEGTGLTEINANDIQLKALSVGFDEKLGRGEHYRNQGIQDVEITHVQGKGNVLISGKNIYTEGTALEAAERLAVVAENSLVLDTAKVQSHYEEYHHTKSGGALGSSKKTTLDTYQDKTQVGTTLDGSDILVSAGNDLKAKNLQAIADKDLHLQAVNNVTISADTDYFKERHFEQKSKSGVFSGGGIGITFGKQSETHEREAEGWQQSQARSTLGSLSGNISVSAGNHAHLSGTDLIASKELDKAIVIEGKSTYIGASEDELSSKERHEYKQSGLTIAFSSAVTDAAMAVQSSLKRSEQVKDERLSQLLKVKAANEAVETVQKASKAIDAIQKAGSVSEGLANSDAKISVSIGASKSVSTSHTKQTTHQGSELSAGAVTVRATEGDNSIVGSKINAKEATIEGSNINLLGTTDTQSNRSDNKNSSWSLGVFVGKSGGSTGLGIEGAASVGKGHSNSDSQVQNHTEINADRLTIKAKETTTLKGATANINHLALDTKNQHIESVQDIEKYDSKQTQGGVKAAFAWGSGASGSAQFSRNKANVDYAQVNQQSGFNINESSDINVKENTHLKGGVINAQGDKANHSLKTGTLTTENIENRSDIKVSSVSAGVSSDMTQMATMAVGAALSALGNTNESERSQTQAAISSNINVQITDSEKQKSLTGKTAEETLQSLNRDVANANQKLEKQDLQALQERQEATQIVAEMGAKAVGDLAKMMNWEDGSPQKIALHGLIGYLSAKVGGGNTAASTLSAMGSEYINTEIANYLQQNTALTADQRNAIQQASAAGLGALIGASLGGDSNTVNQSAQMAWRTEKFNRQLHPDEQQWIKVHAGEFAKEQGISVEEAEKRLTQQAAKGIDILWFLMLDDKIDTSAQAFLSKQSQKTFMDSQGNVQHYFVAKDNDFFESRKYASEANTYNQQQGDKFIERNLQAGIIRSAKDGFEDKVSNVYEKVKEAPSETGKAVAENIWMSAKECGKAPIDCVADVVSNMLMTGKSAVSETYHNIKGTEQENINAVYGKDVSDEMLMVSGLQLTGSVTEILGAGKVVKVGGEAVVDGAVSLGKATISNTKVKLLDSSEIGKITTNGELKNDVNKALPENYSYISDTEVKGPNGGIYTLVGQDIDGNPVYQGKSGNYVSFENGKNEYLVGYKQKPEKEVIDHLYDRSYLRKETKEKILANYEQLTNGNYWDIINNKEIQGPIDIGHAFGWEHRRLSLAADELGWSQQQLNDYVNARPEIFRLENMSENRSHKNEMPGKDDIQRIKNDMENFLKEGK